MHPNLAPNISSFEAFVIGICTLIIGLIVGLFTKRKILLREKEEEFKKIIESERKAKEEAEEAIKARDEFLSIATHELKTPLTTITLRLQSTLDSILNQSLANFSGEKMVYSLSVAQEQTRRLQSLIKDLLNVSLITTGKLDLELTQGNLNEIVTSATSRLEDHIKLANCSLSLKADSQIDGLWDQIRLEQAISNLLTNAIKYGAGQPIEIAVKKEGASAAIEISDHGIGIEPKQQKLIFERFQRATNDKKFQGLGVGLFIVKQIIEAHGGKVDVRSRLGNGSTFIVALPIIGLPIAETKNEISEPPKEIANPEM